MKEQNFKNHVKYYPLHHFLLLPLALGLLIFSAVQIHKAASPLEWWLITGAFFLILFQSVIMRQHYALGNQNRIIRLEMRLRYYQLTNQRFEDIENKFTFGQIAALRFASDKELPALVQRALAEKLSSKNIKMSIKEWYPDYMRV